MVGEQASDPAVLDACSTESSESTSPPAASPGFELEEPDAVSGLQDPNVYVADLEDSKPVLAIDSSIPELLTTIQTGNAARCEQALLLLLQVCIDDQPRMLLYEMDGISVLVEAVKHCHSYFGQLSALKCLSWISSFDSRFPRQEYDKLRKNVRKVTTQELISVTCALTDSDSEDKLKALMCCACVATVIDSEELDDFGVVALIIPLLRDDNATITAWAADTLGNLAERGVFADESIVSALLEFLETGSTSQKSSAAFALGQLSSVNAFNCEAIMNGGGISSLGRLLETGNDTHKALAAFALGSLATSEVASISMVSAGLLPRLVDFAFAGTDPQKEYSAFALGWLAHTDTICELIISSGAISPLVRLVRSGTGEQKKQAALSLANLSIDCTDSTATNFLNEGAIPPLVLLLQVGSDDQKENAVRALANLTMNNERSCAEITNEGAIPVLMELLGTGIGVQKGLAALTLGFLGATNKANSTVLRDAGALGLLVDLLRTEGIEQEQHAVTALEHLTAHNNENLKAVAREDVIAPLVSVLQVGSDTQKELGTVVLGRLAGTQASREKIAAEGVIPLLVGLVRTGTNAQKEEAAHVLGRLAKDETKAVIKSLGAIGILQELQQTGTTGQKRKARVALKAISEDDGGTSKRRRSAPNQTLCFSAIQKGVSMPSSPHSIEELSGGGTLGLEQGVYFIMSFANPKVGANKGVDHEAQWGYCGRDVL
ncbi:hypothetical protein PF002_g8049 [Phytophthora fragariae]|uniref:Uncharacterized protein n=1 Tax=Phytophthora fragariae TaxID=53985 RepID=A0A6A3ZTT4_9STRA|nr:hypothetical protein PF002_g8049 [Phytophthora fragariae]